MKSKSTISKITPISYHNFLVNVDMSTILEKTQRNSTDENIRKYNILVCFYFGLTND